MDSYKETIKEQTIRMAEDLKLVDLEGEKLNKRLDFYLKTQALKRPVISIPWSIC